MNHFKFAVILFLSTSLLACGGGGGGSNPVATVSPAAIAPTSSPVASPASASGAGPGVAISQAIDGHFARLNEVRAAMGLPSLAWNDPLAGAAQKHADYQTINHQLGHAEIAGSPDFSGEGFGARDAAAGYSGAMVSEVIIGGTPDTAVDGRNLMDAMLSAPGHRFALLAYEFSDVGMGSAPLTTNLGTRITRKLPADAVLAYPYEGQNNVPTAYAPGSETPNPLPGVSMTGFPISIHAGIFTNFTVTRVSLTNLQTGADQVLYGLDTLDGPRSAFVFFPRDALASNTSYSFSADVKINGLARQIKSTFTTAQY